MKFLLATLFVLIPRLAFSAVAVDTADVVFGNGIDTISLTYTVTGSNTLALCGTTQQSASLNVSTLTFNSVGMTNITRQQPYSNYEFSAWRMVGVSGTHDFAFTADAVDYLVLACATFTGVDQVTPIGSFLASVNPTTNNLTVPANGMGWDYTSSAGLVDCTNSPYSLGAGQTQLANDCGTSTYILALSSYRTTSGVFDWIPQDWWVDIAVPINPASAAVSVTRRAPIIQ